MKVQQNDGVHQRQFLFYAIMFGSLKKLTKQINLIYKVIKSCYFILANFVLKMRGIEVLLFKTTFL